MNGLLQMFTQQKNHVLFFGDEIFNKYENLFYFNLCLSLQRRLGRPINFLRKFPSQLRSLENSVYS